MKRGQSTFKVISGVTLIILIIAGVVSLFQYINNQSTPNNGGQVNSYEECVAAGNPVLESYPSQCKTPNGETFTENIGNELEVADQIRTYEPRPNQVISSPLTIGGEAVGSWLFEASTDYVLKDGNGNDIAAGIIQAQGEWMTEEFVQFSGTLEFEQPETPRGELIINKSNPSGLPENAAQLRIPVRF